MPKNSNFKAYIEEIRYSDMHSKRIILNYITAYIEEELCFELLAGAIENSDWFMEKAYKAVYREGRSKL